jgi:thyrotropin-releasing hormone receptor
MEELGGDFAETVVFPHFNMTGDDGLQGDIASDVMMTTVNPSVTNDHGNVTFGPMTTDRPIYYSDLYRAIALPLTLIIFMVGFIGNILVVYVVIRIKSMHTPTNCYLLSLAMADILVLLSASLPAVPEPFFQIHEWPWGRYMCSALVFLQYTGVNGSSLSITAFTVERYIAICHPMKAQTICTVRRAKRIIVALWIFNVLYCSPWIYLTTVVEKSRGKNKSIEVCSFRLERSQYTVYYMSDLIAFYVLPVIVAAVLYGLIARILFVSTIPRSPGSTQNGTGSVRSKRQTTARIQVRID